MTDRSLARPVDIASLAVFRIVFGLCGLLGVARYIGYGWVEILYVKPRFFFTWEPFGPIVPDPGRWIYGVYAVLGLSALGVTLGAFWRLSITSYFLAFTFIELIDKTHYLNHYYLVSLLAFLLIFMPANRAWSVDVRRRPELRLDQVPAWTVWALRLQLGAVYFFAGVAKLDADWLAGHPLDIWLATHSSAPWIGPILASRWLPPSMAVAGCVYDLLIPFALLVPRTRAGAYLLVLGFHAAVGLLFDIGMFPFLMIGLTPIFFDPSWPRRWLGAASGLRLPGPVPRWVGPAFVAWFAVQGLVPLRHLLYPGDVAWTEEGFRFSWRVLVVEKRGFFRYRLVDPTTDQRWTISPREELTERQLHQASASPDMLLQYAHHLRDRFVADGHPDIQVFCDAWLSVNGGRSHRLIDPDVDLGREPRWTLSRWRWILPPDSENGVVSGGGGL